MELCTINYDDSAQRWIARRWKTGKLIEEIPLKERCGWSDGNALDEASILLNVPAEEIINEIP